ncbi:Ubiquitin carboxyl-terminal hydrolase isozyme L3 [Fukomys damarensis]|uniref:Ubiquitin carboxyl-terminal hydrolase n=1 Tax=Fukomys damarensis TaxID=885580 RepID=A0A091DPH6_FUKDA|nr:Ubiquitin carboxyl-terminal hydrolase isozyme L3 [Fukomys damarensis]
MGGRPEATRSQVTNQFLRQLGLHPNWQFVDVYGMDPELLSMVPRPVCAVLLLFPITEKAIRVTHETSAHEGQTEAPNIDEKVDLHFIALVHVDGHLYELDGRKPFPINHGKTSDETLLEDAIEVCKKFMERDPDELRFNAIALSAA